MSGRRIYSNDNLSQIEGIRRVAAVTPSDTVDLADPAGAPRPARGLLLHEAGLVNVLLEDDSSPVVVFLVAGVWHPMAVQRVYSTNTDPGLVIRAGW